MQLGLITNWLWRPEQVSRVRKRWRDAANVVATRWEVFLDAEAEGRAFAFASYVAALDAEEAAARELAGVFPRGAA